MQNPELFKKSYNIRKRQLVLKEWHLYRVEQLKKERDSAFKGKYDEVPKKFFTRKV